MKITGLEIHCLSDIRLDLENHIKECSRECVESDFVITRLGIFGSRVTGTASEKSDLDVVIEYEGNYSENNIHNMLNSEPLYIEGILVDFVPYSIAKGNPISERIVNETIFL